MESVRLSALLAKGLDKIQKDVLKLDKEVGEIATLLFERVRVLEAKVEALEEFKAYTEMQEAIADERRDRDNGCA